VDKVKLKSPIVNYFLMFVMFVRQSKNANSTMILCMLSNKLKVHGYVTLHMSELKSLSKKHLVVSLL